MGTSGNPTPIRMPHAHPETFRQFIHYVYTGKVNILDSWALTSKNEIINTRLSREFRNRWLNLVCFQIMLQDSGIFEMLALAQELGVEELWRSCEEHVSATLSPGNACALLTAALDAQDRVLGKIQFFFFSKIC